MKPLVLAIALALLAPLPAFAWTTDAPAAATKPAPATRSPAWVEQSNAYAQILLQAQAPFQPEQMSFFQGLLSDQTPPARSALAPKRLQRYAGLVAGATPITTLPRPTRI